MNDTDREKPIPPPEGVKERLRRIAPSYIPVLVLLAVFGWVMAWDYDRRSQGIALFCYIAALSINLVHSSMPATRLRRALRGRGFRRVSMTKAEYLCRYFGPDASKCIPTRDEALLIPGVEDSTEWIMVRNALTLALWNRDPKHFPLIAKGYRSLNWDQHDALIRTYGDDVAKEAPRHWPWFKTAIMEEGEFSFLVRILAESFGRGMDERLFLAVR